MRTSQSFSVKGTLKKFFIGLAITIAGAALTYLEQSVPLISTLIFNIVNNITPIDISTLLPSEAIQVFINTNIVAYLRNVFRQFDYQQ